MHKYPVLPLFAQDQPEPASLAAPGFVRRTSRQLASWIIFLAATIAVLFASGMALPPLLSLTFNDDPRQIFRTDTDDFQHYLEFSRLFPHEQQDVTAIVRGPLMTTGALRAIRTATKELPALDGVTAAWSLFSEPELSKLAVSLIDAETSAEQTALRDRFRQAVNDDGFLPGRLVSKELQTSGILLALSPAVVNDSAQLREVTDTIENALQHLFMQTDLEFTLTGFPALRVAVRQQVFNDMLLFGTLAVLFSSIVAWLMFRSVLTVLIALIGPLTAVLWTFAAMALLGRGINVLTQMVAVLILVVGFSDSVHITRYIQASFKSGNTRWQVLLGTYQRLAFPCMLTSLTTAAGFLSLCLSDSTLLREFGLVCAIGCTLGFVCMMLCIPFMTMAFSWYSFSLYPRKIEGQKEVATSLSRTGKFTQRLDKLGWGLIPVRWDRPVIGIGFCLTALLVVIALQVKPQYRIGENLPTDNPTRMALQHANDHLDGALPLHVLLTETAAQNHSSDKSESLSTGPTLSVLIKAVREVQRNLNSHTGHHWISSIDASRYAPGFGVVNRVNLLPDNIAERQLNQQERAALISTVIPATASDEIEQQLDAINLLLEQADVSGDVELRPAGFTVVLGNTSRKMIHDLAISLLGAVLLMLVITSTLFRSFKLGLISLVPNLAPVALLAAILVLSGQPLRYSTVVIFSICLGLAIDDTVHIMERFRKGRLSGLTSTQAVERSVRDTGPVLVLTTAIMGAGFASLMFSPTSTLAWMGFLSCMALLSALVIDLTVLPAMLRRFC